MSTPFRGTGLPSHMAPSEDVTTRNNEMNNLLHYFMLSEVQLLNLKQQVVLRLAQHLKNVLKSSLVIVSKEPHV